MMPTGTCCCCCCCVNRACHFSGVAGAAPPLPSIESSDRHQNSILYAIGVVWSNEQMSFVCMCLCVWHGSLQFCVCVLCAAQLKIWKLCSEAFAGVFCALSPLIRSVRRRRCQDKSHHNISLRTHQHKLISVAAFCANDVHKLRFELRNLFCG